MLNPLVILLSTHDGERFLPEQLDSLFSQSRQDFVVLARDDGSNDGSNDGSRDILETFSTRYSGRFYLLPAELANRGACASFALLIEKALECGPGLDWTGEYLMLCDQDDIWHLDKIERQMELMYRAEAGDASIPVLVHSDLEVVDEANQLVAASFVKYQGLTVFRNHLDELALSNLVTGCTTLFNAALAQRALPISEDAIMHGWWLALNASAFGKLMYLNEPTVRYRQHESNTIGAKEQRPPQPVGFGHWRWIIRGKANLHLTQDGRQALAFLRRHRRTLTRGQRRGLWFCSLLRIQIGFLQRTIFRLSRNWNDYRLERGKYR